MHVIWRGRSGLVAQEHSDNGFISPEGYKRSLGERSLERINRAQKPRFEQEVVPHLSTGRRWSAEVSNEDQSVDDVLSEILGWPEKGRSEPLGRSMMVTDAGSDTQHSLKSIIHPFHRRRRTQTLERADCSRCGLSPLFLNHSHMFPSPTSSSSTPPT